MKVFQVFYKLIKYIVVILLVLYFIIICKNKAICGFSFAVVIGNSMYPTIYDGDFLVIRQNASYEINDIICFREEDKLITHRVVEIKGHKVITKGDFNTYRDKEIFQSQVIGKVVYVSSFMGLIFRNVHIIMCALLIYAYFKLKIIDEYDKIYL